METTRKQPSCPRQKPCPCQVPESWKENVCVRTAEQQKRAEQRKYAEHTTKHGNKVYPI